MGKTFSEKAKLLWGLSAVALCLSCGAEKRSTVVQAPAATPAAGPLTSQPPLALPDKPPAPGPDPAEVLISQVEALYKTGTADYRSGNLERATEQFDKRREVAGVETRREGDNHLSGGSTSWWRTSVRRGSGSGTWRHLESA